MSARQNEGRKTTGSSIPLGNRKELFLDQFIIAHMEGSAFRMHTPRDEGSVFTFDKPWEGLFCGYATVMRDCERYYLYYRGKPAASADGSTDETTCRAESLDGIHWERPAFDAKGRNIVFAEAPNTHNFSPFIDACPGVRGDERFKALGGLHPAGLYAFTSPDGISWKKKEAAPVLVLKEFAFDSMNVAFWSASEKKYIVYFRTWKDDIRRISRTTSDDFINWSEPVMLDYKRAGETVPAENIYINQTAPYPGALHIYTAIAARFMPNRQVISEAQAKTIGVNPDYFKDCSDVVLMMTRGGKFYERAFMEGFLKPGIGAENWTSRTNYPACGIVQTGVNEMSFYVVQNYAQPTIHLRRYSLRLDGFASLYAPYDGGEMITKTVTFRGNNLMLNFATSAAGSIRIELQDETGNALRGYTLADCEEIIGNEIERAVCWKGNSGLAQFAGQPVRLRIQLKDADLFALRFQ